MSNFGDKFLKNVMIVEWMVCPKIGVYTMDASLSRLRDIVGDRKAIVSPLFHFWQIEQEKLASLKKGDEDKKEKDRDTRERAQSKSPRR